MVEEENEEADALARPRRDSYYTCILNALPPDPRSIFHRSSYILGQNPFVRRALPRPRTKQWPSLSILVVSGPSPIIPHPMMRDPIWAMIRAPNK
jgi:hypothetical protein